jgi:hypothetical protein
VKMGVFAVGPGGQAQIQTYFRATAVIKRLNEHEPWPGMETIGPDIVLCAEREVIIKCPAACAAWLQPLPFRRGKNYPSN